MADVWTQQITSVSAEINLILCELMLRVLYFCLYFKCNFNHIYLYNLWNNLTCELEILTCSMKMANY
jgi:hypothetical protein